jgi:hypothetical protein
VALELPSGTADYGAPRRPRGRRRSICSPSTTSATHPHRKPLRRECDLPGLDQPDEAIGRSAHRTAGRAPSPAGLRPGEACTNRPVGADVVTVNRQRRPHVPIGTPATGGPAIAPLDSQKSTEITPSPGRPIPPTKRADRARALISRRRSCARLSIPTWSTPGVHLWLYADEWATTTYRPVRASTSTTTAEVETSITGARGSECRNSSGTGSW